MKTHQGALHGPCTQGLAQDTLRALWGPQRLDCGPMLCQLRPPGRGLRNRGQLRQAETLGPQEESRVAVHPAWGGDPGQSTQHAPTSYQMDPWVI